jgi:hypothetical protein
MRGRGAPLKPSTRAADEVDDLEHDRHFHQHADVNVHRIIRRSTTYGAPYDPNATSEHDDCRPYSLMALLVNSRHCTARQFLGAKQISSNWAKSPWYDSMSVGACRALCGVSRQDAARLAGAIEGEFAYRYGVA